MWNFQREELSDGKAVLFRFEHPIHQVVEGLRREPKFRELLTDLLGSCPWDAFTWETTPFNGRTLERKFECVAIKSNRLAGRRPSYAPFSEHFNKAEDQSVAVFANKSRDAQFVVPRPVGSKQTYSHLKSFLLNAPKQQRDDFWESLAVTVTGQLSLNQIWISTSKVGVHWLHVRIDSEPKHYRFPQFREFTETLS